MLENCYPIRRYKLWRRTVRYGIRRCYGVIVSKLEALPNHGELIWDEKMESQRSPITTNRKSKDIERSRARFRVAF